GNGPRRLDGNGELALQRDRAADQLAPKPHQDGTREGAAMPLDEAAQQRGLASRPDRGNPAALLGAGDRLNDLGALDDEIVQLVVDLVDAAAQVVECRSTGGHG